MNIRRFLRDPGDWAAILVLAIIILTVLYIHSRGGR